MMVKCGSMGMAKEVAKFINAEFGLRAISVTSDDMSALAVQQTVKDYREGRIDVLVVCKMLAVGFHDAKTSVLSCLCDMGFSEWLQFFGRGFSIDSMENQQVFMVATDGFWRRSHYDSVFKRYCKKGVTAVYFDEETPINSEPLPENDMDAEGKPVREPAKPTKTYIEFTGSIDELEVTYKTSTLEDDSFQPQPQQPEVLKTSSKRKASLSTRSTRSKRINFGQSLVRHPYTGYQVPISIRTVSGNLRFKSNTLGYLAYTILNNLRNPTTANEMRNYATEQGLLYIRKPGEKVTAKTPLQTDYVHVFDGNLTKLPARLHKNFRTPIFHGLNVVSRVVHLKMFGITSCFLNITAFRKK